MPKTQCKRGHPYKGNRRLHTNGRGTYCVPCSLQRGKDNWASRKYKDGNYGLSRDELVALVESQDNLCAICKLPETRRGSLSIDHDHVTGSVRGLLCSVCNAGIGLLRDDPYIVLRAYLYLGGHL